MPLSFCIKVLSHWAKRTQTEVGSKWKCVHLAWSFCCNFVGIKALLVPFLGAKNDSSCFGDFPFFLQKASRSVRFLDYLWCPTLYRSVHRFSMVHRQRQVCCHTSEFILPSPSKMFPMSLAVTQCCSIIDPSLRLIIEKMFLLMKFFTFIPPNILFVHSSQIN